MERQLTYLFAELQQYSPSSYDGQVITKTLQTIFQQSDQTMQYPMKLENPELPKNARVNIYGMGNFLVKSGKFIVRIEDKLLELKDE